MFLPTLFLQGIVYPYSISLKAGYGPLCTAHGHCEIVFKTFDH